MNKTQVEFPAYYRDRAGRFLHLRGKRGYIDGYVTDATGEIYAMVVMQDRIEAIPSSYLRVINGDYGSDGPEQIDTSK